MSKYRCPRCGATHKELLEHCRLCGMDMTGEHVPLDMDARAPGRKGRSGIASIIVFGVVGVVIVALIGVGFGLSDRNEQLDRVTNRLPIIGNDVPSGWSSLEDPEGRFVVSMPGDAVQTETPFAPAVGGIATRWTATIGEEIVVVVAYADLPPLEPGASDRARLEQLADAWAAANGTSVRRLDTSEFAGRPAVDAELRPVDLNGREGKVRSYLLIEDDRLYVAMVQSIYIDMPQYTRVLTSLELLPEPTSTTEGDAPAGEG